MINILKERLPEGLELESVKDSSSRKSYEVILNYKGMRKSRNLLPKECDPGKEKLVCDMVISIAMTVIGVSLNDDEMTKKWKAKQEWLTDLWTMAEKSSKKQ